MTDRVETLKALVEQWRAKEAVINSWHATMGNGWRVCADELSALIAAGLSESRLTPTTMCPDGEPHVLRCIRCELPAAGLSEAPAPQEKGRQVVIPEVSRGIRMLGLVAGEHPHADVYNEALKVAAWYVESVWSTPGRGANAPKEISALASPAPPKEPT